MCSFENRRMARRPACERLLEAAARIFARDGLSGATTREIAGPVLFLCTPLAGFISGEVLNVNGGAVLVG